MSRHHVDYASNVGGNSKTITQEMDNVTNESGLNIETSSSQYNVGKPIRKVNSPQSDRTFSEEETNSIVLEMKEMDEMFRTTKKKSKFVHLYQSSKKLNTNQSAITQDKLSTVSHHENNCLSCCGTLRWSTVLILTLVFSLMIIIFVAIISSIIITSYDELERDESKADMKRVVKSFFDEFTNALEIIQQVAIWDDPYQLLLRFYDPMENQTQLAVDMQLFLETNVDSAQMLLEKNNYVLIYTLNGTLIGHRAHSLSDETQDLSDLSKIPQELLQLDVNSSPLFKNSEKAGTSNGGFLQVSNGVLENNQIVMLIAKPISQSNFNANNPTSGLIVYGRHLTYETKERNAFRSATCVSFLNLNETLNNYSNVNATRVSVSTNIWENDHVSDIVTFGELSTRSSIDDRHCYTKSDLNSTSPRVGSIQFLADLYGNPLLAIRSDTGRNVYLIGIRSLALSIALLVFSCILAGIIIIVFVERRVLRRIYKLSRRIQEITASHDPKQRIEIRGVSNDGSINIERNIVIHDEIDTTAKYINEMLFSLEIILEEQLKEQKMLKKLLERVYTAEESGSAIMNAVKDVVFIVNGESGLVLNANNRFYEQMERSVMEVEGKDQVYVSNLFLEMKALEAKFQNNLTTALLSLNDGKSHIFRAMTPSGKIIRYHVFVSKTKVMQNNKKKISFLFMAKKDDSLTLGNGKESIHEKFEKMIQIQKRRENSRNSAQKMVNSTI